MEVIEFGERFARVGASQADVAAAEVVTPIASGRFGG